MYRVEYLCRTFKEKWGGLKMSMNYFLQVMTWGVTIVAGLYILSALHNFVHLWDDIKKNPGKYERLDTERMSKKKGVTH